MIGSPNQTMANVSAVPLLDFSRSNQSIKTEILELFAEILDSGHFIGGPYVQQLEALIAEACQANFGIGCASGSDALLLALMSLNIQAGDEVICPSFTFFATASAIVRLGGTPVFADIRPSTFNIDTDHVRELITEKTRAIIPVHLFGQCCEMDAIQAIAQQHGLAVIEDCAQAIGASFNGCRAGSMGAVGCFSFYPTKNVGGLGDGGMITTNDEDLAGRMRLLANHGMSPRYYHSEVGINSRLDAVQAAALTVKMKSMEQCNQKRRENADYYRLLMKHACLTPLISVPEEVTSGEHVWNQFTIRIPNGMRDQVRQRLAAANVGTEVYYPVPLHRQECFSQYDAAAGTLTQTEKAAAEVLSLPIFPELSRSEQEYVVESLGNAIRELLW